MVSHKYEKTGIVVLKSENFGLDPDQRIFKKICIGRRTTRARAASNSRWTDARVLAPSRPVRGWSWLWLSGVHASPVPSLQKNFREDENLFFRSVTGLAILGFGSGTLQLSLRKVRMGALPCLTATSAALER